MPHPVVLIAVILAAVLIYVKFKLQWSLNKELGELSPEKQTAWFVHRKPSRKMLGLLFLAAVVIVLAMYFVIPASFFGGAAAYLVFLAAVLIYTFVERSRLNRFVRNEGYPEPFQRAVARTKNMEVGVLTFMTVLMALFFFKAAS